MKVYIFAIGGTGARVLRSLSFCLASGMDCIPTGTTFVPMIIDYDVKNGDKLRATNCLNWYREVRNAAYKGVTPEADDRSLFMPEVESLTPGISFDFNFGTTQATTKLSFADEIGVPEMTGGTSLTRDLLASLYNDLPGQTITGEDNSEAELNLNLSVGFKGNPNIGSLVFEGLKDSAEFKKFRDDFNPAEDRVFIISSMFGGTGSSGFPRIVNAIRQAGITGFDTAPVGAAIVLPYYDVATPLAGGAINSQIFNSKEKAALSYYNTSGMFDQITRSYFIGDTQRTTLDYSEGADTQKNDAQVVEVIAALALIDFVKTDKTNTMGQQLDYGYTANSNVPQNPNDAMGPFTLREVGKEEYNTYYQYIARMALAFRYYREWVCTDDIPAKTAYYKEMDLANVLETGMFKPLDDFTKDFDCWLDELALQSDSFKPFVQKPRNTDSKQPVADDLGDYLTGYMAKSGGLFSSGSSFKDFDSYCNKHYKEYGKNETNTDYALLCMYYDAAEDCLNCYKKV